MNLLNKIIQNNKQFSLYTSGEVCWPAEFCGVLINSEFGRFGNNVKQLRNSLRIAMLFGVKIIALSDEVFSSWLPEFKSFNYEGYTVIRVSDEHELSNGVWLSSDFFDISVFNDYLKFFDDVWFSAFFKNILKQNINKKLAIHVRSGDVFSIKPHPAYVQPPFEYYKIAIEDYFSSQHVDKVSLVCEDFKNPVANKLIEYFSVIDISFSVNSDNFISGFNDLRCSDCAIFGVGSFAQPALFSSQNLDRVYFPNYEVEGMRVAKKMGFLVKYIILHDYIKVGEWINSDEQLKSLLEHMNCSSPFVF